MNRIEVTQADIDAQGNPISNAVKRTFNAYQVSTGLLFCSYALNRRDQEVVMVLNDEAQQFMVDYLAKRPLKPFYFPVQLYCDSGPYICAGQ